MTPYDGAVKSLLLTTWFYEEKISRTVNADEEMYSVDVEHTCDAITNRESRLSYSLYVLRYAMSSSFCKRKNIRVDISLL